MTEKKSDFEFYAQVAAVFFLGAMLLYQINLPATGMVSASSVIPTGIPAVYGEELGIMYDHVSANNAQQADTTIRLMGNIDRTETLEGEELERYIEVLYNQGGGMSCEYCCGAKSIIFEDGKAACGCAHSYAMRGLAKYLIKYHGDEYTDEEITAEVGKWKVLFFPGIMEGKAAAMEAQGLDSSNYFDLATNKYRGIEQGKANGGMVGGC